MTGTSGVIPATGVAAEVAGHPVLVSDVDRREAVLRTTGQSVTLPAAGTSEGRQLRRWLTQLLVAERVVELEAVRLDVDADPAPDIAELLPDVTARVEIGSVPAALLDADPLARALFRVVTAGVTVAPDEVRDYYRRNRTRYASPAEASGTGWHVFHVEPPQPSRAKGQSRPDRKPWLPLADVRDQIERELTGAARRLTFRRWLDQRVADLVRLRPGYEHPADPAQPDNTHRH